MNIVEVKQNWPDDFFRVELYISNICNYQCWYCWPGCHEGTIKWPDYNLLVTNLSHLIDHYKKTTNKKRFQIGLLGGEIIHWKRLIDFIKHFKENYDCIFTMHTNASKKLEWWKQATPYFDHVSISHHPEFSKMEHNREVADYLYSQGKIVNISVMMDPTAWDSCLDAINYYSKSKYRWSIRKQEIFHDTIKYTPEQTEELQNLRTRGTNPLFFLLHNKTPRSKPRVVDDKNKVHKITDQYLTLNRLIDFRGWECSVGKDWLNIKNDGSIAGICSNRLYDQSVVYNIFDTDFVKKFHPQVTTTICHTKDCWCDFETNMPKKKITSSTTKIIPIKEIK